MSLKTTDLCDAHGSTLQVAEDIFCSFGGRRSFHGPIFTVSVFEDNVLVREAIESIPVGSVLVVDGGGSKRCALLGDRLAAIAIDRGLAGIIINGCVRDTADLVKMEIGVLAVGKSPRKSVKRGKGKRDIPVQFAGMNWIPNQYAYVDEDGIVISKTSLA
ncbi:ribonuclease E activity regulator RraA [Hazenella sp. IB182353]|uniref:ribonuclease E activity regulator RraA n=1 Tax=Polycladospora coralii TaxID=2771432 RepID=UPI00174643FA|nr:ribonuclease E activity regulator RraA [Polycladospora coralii]MBS7530983.1 ribonuclease E activity regulator RraA [Polycladospora coralii]